MSRATLILKEKRVSVRFVSIDSFSYTWICINKCFPLAEMTTKFNKDMYARMRGKKDEPLSAIGAKTARVTERGAPISSVPPSTPTLGTVGIASSTPSIEELTSQHKRPRTGDKQKEKVDSRSSSVWDDAGVALARAQDVFNADDLKVFSGVSANKVVGRHLHKLVQVPMQIYILHSSLLLSFFFFFFFFFLRCWERVSTSPQSTWLRRPRSSLGGPM